MMKMKAYIQQGYQYSDMAVLVRTNLGPRFLVEKLMEYNIPFHMKDAMPNIYEHFIGKDLIAYMKLATGQGSRAEYLQIINHPKRYVSREAFVKEDTGLQDLIDYHGDGYGGMNELPDVLRKKRFRKKVILNILAAIGIALVTILVGKIFNDPLNLHSKPQNSVQK
jgi:DNA helicase-2/ATP-dependent DNA helicase PcrA